MCNDLNNPFTSKQTCPILCKRAADNYNALCSIGPNGKKQTFRSHHLTTVVLHLKMS